MNNLLIDLLLEKACLLQQTDIYLSFSAIHPHQARWGVPSWHIAVEDHEAVKSCYADLLKMNQQGWGIYVGIGYRRGGLSKYQRGGKADVIALPAIFVDVDRAPSEVLPLSKFMPQPTLAVASGNGTHLYWFLETPTPDFERAQSILKGMALDLNADLSMSVDQILRLPNSLNTKEKGQGRACRILNRTTQTYNLDAFFPYEVMGMPEEPPAQPQLPARRSSSQSCYKGRQLNPMLMDAILSQLMAEYGAVAAEDGWYACLCPFAHQHDRHAGDHAYFHPEKGLLNCFGKHGWVLSHELARQLNLDVTDYGGIYLSNGLLKEIYHVRKTK